MQKYEFFFSEIETFFQKKWRYRNTSHDSGLEVAVVVAFHAYAGAREVGGADIGCCAVEYHYFEMHSWTELALQF